MRVERGRLSAIFDPSFAFLREIALDGEELFRGVGFVARDANWGTPALRGEATVADGADALVVESAGELTAGDLQWRLRWTVSATAVEVEGQWSSRSGFTTNRTGFVVLHSLGAARGRPVEIDHPDGAREASTFPTLVSPHQPFFDIAAMRYESAAGADIRLRFDGEIFETEDQRNWTDASYKTYCRPLRLPYPYGIEPGAQVRQGLRIDLRPSPRRPATRDESDPIVGPPIDAPLLGSSLPPGTPAVGVAQALKRLALDFTALEIEPTSADFARDLQAALDLVEGPVRLDFRPAPSEVMFSAAREALSRLGGRPCLGVTLCGAGDDEIDAVRALRPGLRVGAGSATFFAELNRMRPTPARADYLTFAATPTVHGDSDDTIGETTETLEDLIASYEAMAPGRALHVGPLTLGPRFNPNATTPEGRLGAVPDARQSRPIAAAWALATISGALAPATRALCVFEPLGLKGLVSATGELTFAAQVLQWLSTARGRRLRAVRWPAQARVRGLLLEAGDAPRLWIAHGHAGAQKIALPSGQWRIADSAAEAPPRLDAGTLALEGFCAVELSRD